MVPPSLWIWVPDENQVSKTSSSCLSSTSCQHRVRCEVWIVCWNPQIVGSIVVSGDWKLLKSIKAVGDFWPPDWKNMKKHWERPIGWLFPQGFGVKKLNKSFVNHCLVKLPIDILQIYLLTAGCFLGLFFSHTFGGGVWIPKPQQVAMDILWTVHFTKFVFLDLL